MNCPQCAEAFGWRQLYRRQPCAYCRTPVDVDATGTVLSYARKHGEAILKAPRGWRYWALFGVAVAASGVVVAVPTVGILPLLLLPVVQSFSTERTTVRYKEHFGLLHGVVNDFYGLLLFLGVVLVMAALNALTPVVGGVAAALLFAGYWFLNEAYCRWHFRQVARGERPSILELLGVGAVFAAVALPPTALFVAVLWSYYF